MQKFVLGFALAFAGCAGCSGAHAHDIPADVRLNIFFKPAGNKLEVLVRAPLSALREVDFPKSGPGYLVVSKADDALHARLCGNGATEASNPLSASQ